MQSKSLIKKAQNNDTVLNSSDGSSSKLPQQKSSKGCRRFISRLDYFFEDLELVELIYEGHKILTKEKVKFASIDDNKYPRLSKVKNSPYGRDLTIRHLRNTLYASFIKDMHEETYEYIDYIIKNIKNSKIKTAVKRNKRPFGKLSLMDEKLHLGIYKIISDARPYLRCRDFIVHKNGELDSVFISKYPQIPREAENKVLTNRLRIDKQFIQVAYDKINNLIRETDKRLYESNMFPNAELE